MKGKPFIDEMKQVVKLVESNEQGVVIGRAEFDEGVNSYLLRYRAGNGVQTDAWWPEPAVEAA